MNRNRPLSGKSVVVTGSSRGIGYMIAEACAAAGAVVVISSRSEAGVTAAVEGLKSRGFDVTGVQADVSNPHELKTALSAAVERCGRVDVWINNAGISGGYRTLSSFSPTEINEVVGTNMLGTLFGCALVIPYFLSQGGGIVINVSGKGGSGDASPYLAAYAATKAAVTSLTRSLAAENRRLPISIHCFFPGIVATDMWHDIRTCPETASRLDLIPVLIDAWATSPAAVGKTAVRICSQKPGRHSGKSYHAGSFTRYLRGPLVLMRYFIQKRLQKRKAGG